MDKEFVNRISEGCAEYIKRVYPSEMIISGDFSQIKPFIEKYISDIPDIPDPERKYLEEYIYSEMTGYSVLTPYLKDPYVDEININSYDDITVTYSSLSPYKGKTIKLNETFKNKEHALDIIRRLLRENGEVIDYSSPVTSSYIENEETGTNIRITVISYPVIPKRCGVCASIRILHKSENIKKNFSSFLSDKAFEFLKCCIKYGVSVIICGRTDTGKTTLCNEILSQVPDSYRIFTIEQGSREFNLSKYSSDGKFLNNTVSTLTKERGKGEGKISQEDLLSCALRFNPDIIAVGEMRNEEAHACVEASLTGHTVISTVHSGMKDECHTRIAMLMQKRSHIDFSYSLSQAKSAFPIIVFCHKLKTGERKAVNICAYDQKDGTYKDLYIYNTSKDCFEEKEDLPEMILSKLRLCGLSNEEERKWRIS